jgi:hypothetical protein
MAGKPFPNPDDYLVARLIAAGVLVAVFVLGVLVNLYSGQERFSLYFSVADLLAVGGLLGLNWSPR